MIAAIRDFNVKAVAFGSIIEFRKLLHNACKNAFSQRCPALFDLIYSAGRNWNNKYERPPLLDDICSGIGIDGYTNSSFIEAARGICAANDALDQNIWAVLPVVFGISLWHLAFEECIYNSLHDCKFRASS